MFVACGIWCLTDVSALALRRSRLPYQPLLPTQKKQFFFKTSLPVTIKSDPPIKPSQENHELPLNNVLTNAFTRSALALLTCSYFSHNLPLDFLN